MTNHITHWINGSSWAGSSDRKGDVFNPATGLKTGEVDLAKIATIDGYNQLKINDYDVLMTTLAI
jgi:malonate-semialdehyde dehydrogenase (acetylating)/methylmalonate-semialdehyde dehydrogenase